MLGCELGAQLCSVLFRVSYLDTMGAAHDLWTVGEFLDGHHVDLDLDLSDLAGQQIRIVLSVSNLGSSDGRPRSVGCALGSSTCRGCSAGEATAQPDEHVAAQAPRLRHHRPPETAPPSANDHSADRYADGEATHSAVL